MLAEVARRRSSWLRSLATARRLSRPLQLQAREDEDDEAAGRDAKRPPRAADASSLSFHLRLQAGAGASAAWASERLRAPGEAAGPGRFLELIAGGAPGARDVQRARESLHKLARDLADPRAAGPRESGAQRARRQLKAATGKLDRMLYAMRQRRDHAQVEALAFVWEEEFPHFAGQRKHWQVICEHYALSLNAQQRFQDVADKFASCYREQGGDERAAKEISLLTPRLAQSIFVALGHLRDAARTLKLLTAMKQHDIHVTKVSYFHVLNALLHDESFTDFGTVLQICEAIVAELPGETVPLSLLPIVMMTAAACGESKRAMKFYNFPSHASMSMFTEFRFEICLQQLNHLGEDAMLMEIYRDLMASSKASRDLKERVSKFLFRKRVASTTVDTRNKRLGVACEILEIMNQHKIRANNHGIYPLLRTLLLEPLRLENNDSGQENKWTQHRVERAEDIHNFFVQFPHSLEWNEFVLCEAVVASVRTHRADLVDDLFVYALDSGMSIKYAALEQVVVYYYRLGLFSDLERVSDLVRALRLNKHIPLGVSVTEIAMAANLRLHRYEEVVMLFEDFSSLDGERKRVLKRRFMLKTVLSAYKHLGRGDEAMAIQALLNQTDNNLLEVHEHNEVGDLVEEVGLGVHDGECTDEKRGNDDSDSDEVGEQERLSLRRFNH